MSDSILKIENLAACYGDFMALESADVQVGKGEIVAIIGANGAGKSTLVNCVAGLHKPTGGKVFFKGEDITGAAPEKIVEKGLSLVPESGRCFSRMSVHDNLMMGSFPKRSRKQALETIEYIYDLFPDLRTKRRDPVGSLSGGQRQMVAIGRAIMSQPECLIFDEISLGLSPVIIKDIYKTILRIKEASGTSIILIEQDTQRAMKYADTIYVMLKGKTVLNGCANQMEQDSIKKAYFGL